MLQAATLLVGRVACCNTAVRGSRYRIHPFKVLESSKCRWDSAVPWAQELIVVGNGAIDNVRIADLAKRVIGGDRIPVISMSHRNMQPHVSINETACYRLGGWWHPISVLEITKTKWMSRRCHYVCMSKYNKNIVGFWLGKYLRTLLYVAGIVKDN